MFRYNNGQFRVTPPAKIEFEGFQRRFGDLTREQWAELGYHEAVPLRREPFTTYETEWVKGDDLIYREKVVAATVDEASRSEAEKRGVRTERDRRLRATDWTQLKDTTLEGEAMVHWQGYRQALRDVPQQAGFPGIVDWPEEPIKE